MFAFFHRLTVFSKCIIFLLLNSPIFRRGYIINRFGHNYIKQFENLTQMLNSTTAFNRYVASNPKLKATEIIELKKIIEATRQSPVLLTKYEILRKKRQS